MNLKTLDSVLGEDLLAPLLGISVAKLQKYVDDPSRIPSHVEDRLGNICAIVRNLEHCYTPERMKNFFRRNYSQLGHKRPMDILKGDWWPRDREALAVLALSANLSG